MSCPGLNQRVPWYVKDAQTMRAEMGNLGERHQARGEPRGPRFPPTVDKVQGRVYRVFYLGLPVQFAIIMIMLAL